MTRNSVLLTSSSLLRSPSIPMPSSATLCLYVQFACSCSSKVAGQGRAGMQARDEKIEYSTLGAILIIHTVRQYHTCLWNTSWASSRLSHDQTIAQFM